MLLSGILLGNNVSILVLSLSSICAVKNPLDCLDMRLGTHFFKIYIILKEAGKSLPAFNTIGVN